MSRPTVDLKLVSAPPARRTCPFCNGFLTAIELWHNCPQRRLAIGLHRLRVDAREANLASLRKRRAERRAQRSLPPPS